MRTLNRKKHLLLFIFYFHLNPNLKFNFERLRQTDSGELVNNSCFPSQLQIIGLHTSGEVNQINQINQVNQIILDGL